MSDHKHYCMVMKINVDCNSCCRKLRRIILTMKAIETHMIEKENYRLIVFGRFKPSDIAIKIRKKMNRRVEILDVEEMDPDPADRNPPAPEQIQAGPNPNHNLHIPMFPSLEHDHRRPPIFPSPAAGADGYRRCFQELDMAERFWHYGYERDSPYNYNYNYNQNHDYSHY